MLDLLQDLWGFMKVRKKFWLLPIILMLLLLGTLIVLTEGSAVAPFIYTPFLVQHQGFVGAQHAVAGHARRKYGGVASADNMDKIHHLQGKILKQSMGVF